MARDSGERQWAALMPSKDWTEARYRGWMLHLPDLTPAALALRVARLYALDCAGLSTSDPVQGEALARWLDAHPELLERVWTQWARTLSPAERAHCRYWLDACLLGGIAQPDRTGS